MNGTKHLALFHSIWMEQRNGTTEQGKHLEQRLTQNWNEAERRGGPLSPDAVPYANLVPTQFMLDGWYVRKEDAEHMLEFVVETYGATPVGVVERNGGGTWAALYVSNVVLFGKNDFGIDGWTHLYQQPARNLLPMPE